MPGQKKTPKGPNPDHGLFPNREGQPVRACPVEVIGVQPSRTQVKRRKAISKEGELAPGSNALFPWVPGESNGDGMVAKSVDLTLGALSGPTKVVGRTTQEGKPTTRQSNENRAVPKGGRKPAPTWEIKPPDLGKVVPVNEQAIQRVPPVGVRDLNLSVRYVHGVREVDSWRRALQNRRCGS